MCSLKKEVDKCIKVLNQGGVILYPTDTIWGLGCDATNAKAVQKVYSIKNRVNSKSLIVLLDSFENLTNYVEELNDNIKNTIDDAIKPTTIIYPNAKGIDPAVIADDNSVAIRITNEEFSHLLCKEFNKPLVSTSANISGEVTPKIYKEISSIIKESVDYIAQYNLNNETESEPSSILIVNSDGSINTIRE